MALLKRAWNGWKKIARKIGDFQARVILGIFYFVILGPLSIIIRKNDPLAIRGKSPKGWLSKEQTDGTPLKRAQQQS